MCVSLEGFLPSEKRFISRDDAYIAGTHSFCICFYVCARTWIPLATHEEISKPVK